MNHSFFMTVVVIKRGLSFLQRLIIITIHHNETHGFVMVRSAQYQISSLNYTVFTVQKMIDHYP